MADTNLTATKVDLRVTEFSNEEALLKHVNPDLFRIYRAIMVILKFGGNGSIEAHFVRGKLKEQQGVFIKPGFDDRNAPLD